MSGRFNGWPEQAFDVLLKLEGDPPAAFRETLRKEREQLVRQPMIALLQDVADADPTYDDFSVWGFRIMLWPWQRQAARVLIERGVELGVIFDLDGLHVHGGGWYFGPEREAFRAAVADDTSGSALVTIVEALRTRGYDITGDVMKRVPRGYPADHPRADLLRHRTLSAGRPLGCDGWLHTPEAVDRVLAAFEDLRPLMSWLADHAVVDAEVT
ncbi:DUF2461 family protein [Actinopolymorpha sp. B11F2]|uniref:DUF2461 family protein n=1 Tax=Actinopolymorpha sp. B11F2 TaxID=3160862 RepID=UPI0032E4E315